MKDDIEEYFMNIYDMYHVRIAIRTSMNMEGKLISQPRNFECVTRNSCRA